MSLECLPPEKVIRLKAPIDFAGQTYAELRLREPTRKAVKRIAGKKATDATIELMFDSAAVPVGVIEQIPSRALREAREWLLKICAPMQTPDPLPESFTVPLSAPITHEADTLHALTLREPTAGEMRRAEALNVDMADGLMSVLTGHPAHIFEQMKIREYNRAEAYLSGFI